MEDLRDFMIEKKKQEKGNTSCPHMLIVQFHRIPGGDAHYCLTCRNLINKNDLWNNHVIELFQDPETPDIMNQYLDKLNEEIERIYNKRVHNDTPFPVLPALAIYLFNFACADFQDPWKLDENPNR